jgi:hypothetical protein
VDGWVDGWVDGCMRACVHVHVHVCMGAWVEVPALAPCRADRRKLRRHAPSLLWRWRLRHEVGRWHEHERWDEAGAGCQGFAGRCALLPFRPFLLLLLLFGRALGSEAVQLEVGLKLNALCLLRYRAAGVSGGVLPGCGRPGPRLCCSPCARRYGCECQAANSIAQLRARGRQGGCQL